VLLRELRCVGYRGGKAILQDYVRPFKLPREPKATVVFEVRPG